MVMRTMRENTKWIMLATAIAFVALMVFEWGMDASGRSGTQFAGGEVGRVNGEPVAYDEYMEAYRALYDRQQQFVDGPIGTAMNRQIEDAAWDQVVVQRLIAQELKRRGIVVTDDEVRQAARYEPPPELQNDPLFQTDGQFDLERYHAYLSSPAVDPQLLLNLEAYYRDAIPRSKLLFQTTAGTHVSDDALWRMWRDARDQVTLQYLAFEPEALVDDAAITITPEEIASYYRVNREDFIRPARATVRYVAIDRSPNAADSLAALDRARQIRAEIAGGADFAEVAQRESADSVSAADGGRLEIVKGQTVPVFEETAFSQRINEVSEPILSQFGYHVIRTERRSGDSATVRHVLIPVELRLAREDSILDRADSLDVLTETLNLADAARAVGLESADAELIPGLAFVPGIGLAEDGASWAFEDAEFGDVSQLFETESHYYAFELVSREEERNLTQDEATETVRAALTSQKKLERAREMARAAVDRIRAGESLEAVAASTGMTVREAGPFARIDFVPGLGRTNPAIGAAFGLRPGQTSGVVESDNTLYVIHVVSRTDADRAEWEAQKDEQRQRAVQLFAEQRWNRYLAALRENARIVDNRKALQQQAAAQPAPPIL
ncbi:MAG: SurA N-terminal domain-containing protein [Gemmatimonadetes bacterium]|nr:SurA N-terminal domain-containing protein [Gemmatimonadota bacterium]